MGRAGAREVSLRDCGAAPARRLARHCDAVDPGRRYFDPAAGAVHSRKLSSVAFDFGDSSSGGAFAPRR